MITALAGGVGAAKLLIGLIKIIDNEKLNIIVNTGDDIVLYGLYISPDIDIVSYTLAGIVDEERGWGIKGDTFNCLEMLNSYGYDVWFKIGDRDIATHLHRTSLIKKGLKLSEVTANISKFLGLKVNIIPMTDDKFETHIITKNGSEHFQEYLVKNGARDEVFGVKFINVENASPAPGVINSIIESKGVIICPSNPIVSIGTILSVKGIREALINTKAKKIAITPIISGAPIKGPADKLMKGFKMEVSSYSVAKLYDDFIDTFILDRVDSEEKKRIEELGIEVLETNTLMKTNEDKINLAKFVLDAIKY